MKWYLVSLCVAAATAQKLGSPYFYLDEGSTKCFLEDVAEGVPLTVTYSNEDNPGIPCSIQFKDTSQRVVLSRSVTHEHFSGKVSYLVKQNGEHSVCVQCESTQWFASSQLKWTLSVDIGDTELNLPVRLLRTKAALRCPRKLQRCTTSRILTQCSSKCLRNYKSLQPKMSIRSSKYGSSDGRGGGGTHNSSS